MSIPSAVSISLLVNPVVRRAVVRVGLSAIGVFTLLQVPLRMSDAQASPQTSAAQASDVQMPVKRDAKWEVRFTSGALVGTGVQRSTLSDAQLSAAQLSWLVRPSLAVTGSFGWARSRVHGAEGRPKIDVFNSDVGVELRPAKWFAERAVTVSPFAGAGAGVRSYNYRSLTADATNNLAGYLALGGELGVRRVAVRLEARDYATRFKPLVGVRNSSARNDVVLMAGVRLTKRQAAQR